MFEYQGLTDVEAICLVSTIWQRCLDVGGAFTLLWHNSALASAPEREIYLKSLGAVDADS